MLPTSAPESQQKKSTAYGSIASPHDNVVEVEDDVATVVGNTSKFTTTVGITVSVIFVGLLIAFAIVTQGNIRNSSFSALKAIVTTYSSSGNSNSVTTQTSTSSTGVNSGVALTSTTTSTSSSSKGVGANQDSTSPTTTMPNFIMIVADDLGWNSLGYNDDDIAFATPILTNMARKGITLGNYYAQEVCSPSRGSLLTGRYPLSIGMQYGMVAANAEWGMSLDETTIAEVLKDNHYTTHMLGD